MAVVTLGAWFGLAMDEELERHRTELRRWACRLGAGAADADDLAQDVLVRYLEHGGGIRDQRAARAWLWTTLTRAWADRHRGEPISIGLDDL